MAAMNPPPKHFPKGYVDYFTSLLHSSEPPTQAHLWLFRNSIDDLSDASIRYIIQLSRRRQTESQFLRTLAWGGSPTQGSSESAVRAWRAALRHDMGEKELKLYVLLLRWDIAQAEAYGSKAMIREHVPISEGNDDGVVKYLFPRFQSWMEGDILDHPQGTEKLEKAKAAFLDQRKELLQWKLEKMVLKRQIEMICEGGDVALRDFLKPSLPGPPSHGLQGLRGLDREAMLRLILRFTVRFGILANVPAMETEEMKLRREVWVSVLESMAERGEDFQCSVDLILNCLKDVYELRSVRTVVQMKERQLRVSEQHKAKQ